MACGIVDDIRSVRFEVPTWALACWKKCPLWGRYGFAAVDDLHVSSRRGTVELDKLVHDDALALIATFMIYVAVASVIILSVT
jgi:hypothetical protein